VRPTLVRKRLSSLCPDDIIATSRERVFMFVFLFAAILLSAGYSMVAAATTTMLFGIVATTVVDRLLPGVGGLRLQGVQVGITV
jgi:hypothetical protein